MIIIDKKGERVREGTVMKPNFTFKSVRSEFVMYSY